MITISQLFSQTTDLIRAHYRTFGIYMLLLIAPTVLFILLQQVVVEIDPSTGAALINTKNVVIGVLTRTVITFSMFWASIGIIYATGTILQTSQAPDIRQDLSKAGRMLLPTFLLSVIISVLTFFFFLLLIIPGIIVSIWLGFSYHTYLLEHTTIFQSMKRSKTLVTGRFWQIFLHFAIIGLISTAFVFVLTIIPTILLPFLGLDSLIPYISYIASACSVVYVIVAITILYKSVLALPTLPQIKQEG